MKLSLQFVRPLAHVDSSRGSDPVRCTSALRSRGGLATVSRRAQAPTQPQSHPRRHITNTDPTPHQPPYQPITRDALRTAISGGAGGEGRASLAHTQAHSSWCTKLAQPMAMPCHWYLRGGVPGAPPPSLMDALICRRLPMQQLAGRHTQLPADPCANTAQCAPAEPVPGQQKAVLGGQVARITLCVGDWEYWHHFFPGESVPCLHVCACTNLSQERCKPNLVRRAGYNPMWWPAVLLQVHGETATAKRGSLFICPERWV